MSATFLILCSWQRPITGCSNTFTTAARDSAGDRWRQAYPTDGLMDSREERFELVLGAGAKSPVVVRATDGLGNVATAILR